MRKLFSLFLLFLSFNSTFSQEVHTEYVLSGYEGERSFLSGKEARAFDLEKGKKEQENISILNYHFDGDHSNLLREVTTQTKEIEFLDESGKSYVFLRSEHQDSDAALFFSFSGEYRESPISTIYSSLADPLPYSVPYFMGWGECPDEYPDFMSYVSFELKYKDEEGKLLMKRRFKLEAENSGKQEASIRILDIFVY